jgi:hypothetical protein
MDLAVVFHLPSPGGRIQAGKLVSLRKGPSSKGRACAGFLRKVCAGAPNHPPKAAYYAQTTGDSTGEPGGTMHFRDLLAILFHQLGQHHHVRASLTWLRHMPEHGRRPW